jgi:hypothetical protein
MSTPADPGPSGDQQLPPVPGEPYRGEPRQGEPYRGEAAAPGAAPASGLATQAPPPPPPNTAGEPAPAPKRRIPAWLYWVIGAVVVALVAGTIVFFVVRKNSSGAAASPEKAAEMFAKNTAEKDVFGLASQAAPSEYAPYAQHLTALLKDSGLNEAVTGDAKKDPIAALDSTKDILDAVDLKRSDMETKVSHRGKKLAAVDVTSWDLDAKIDKAKMEQALRKVQKTQATESMDSTIEKLHNTPQSKLSFKGDSIKKNGPLRLVMVKEEKGWYVSPTLTLLESSRLDDDPKASDPEPDWNSDPAATKGAKTPEKAVSSLFDTILSAKSLKDFYNDDVLSHLALPERRAVMLYRPFLDKAVGDAGSDGGLGMAGLGRIGSLINIDWDLKTHRVSDDLSVVSMGGTKISIPMAGSVQFDGAKLTIPGNGGVDLGKGLKNPGRLGFAAVKDSGGWRVSLLDSGLNFYTMKANAWAIELGKKKYEKSLSADSKRPQWNELPALAQNALGITEGFSAAFDEADSPSVDSVLP